MGSGGLGGGLAGADAIGDADAPVGGTRREEAGVSCQALIDGDQAIGMAQADKADDWWPNELPAEFLP